MSASLNPLARRRPTGFSERIADIKHWIRTALALDEDAVISVNELACGEPGCPPRETAILVLPHPGEARRYAVHKPVLDVVEADIIEAVRPGRPTGN